MVWHCIDAQSATSVSRCIDYMINFTQHPWGQRQFDLTALKEHNKWAFKASGAGASSQSIKWKHFKFQDEKKKRCLHKGEYFTSSFVKAERLRMSCDTGRSTQLMNYCFNITNMEIQLSSSVIYHLLILCVCSDTFWVQTTTSCSFSNDFNSESVSPFLLLISLQIVYYGV